MAAVAERLEVPTVVGTSLRRQRQAAELTTAEVAEAAGFSPWLLFLIENGQSLAGAGPEEVLEGIERVCRVLELDPDPLLSAVGGIRPTTTRAIEDPPTAVVAVAAPNNTTTTGSADEATLHNLFPQMAGSDVVPAHPARRRPARRVAASTGHRAAPTRRPVRSVRVLRLASLGAALAVTAVAVTLVLVGGPAPGSRTPTAAAASTRPSGGTAGGQAVGAVPGLETSSPSSATLAVGASSYMLKVTAAGPCWVEIRTSAGRDLWAGTLSAGQEETYKATGVTLVQLGAGGSHLSISWAGHRYTLSPSVAPYTYTLQPR